MKPKYLIAAFAFGMTIATGLALAQAAAPPSQTTETTTTEITTVTGTVQAYDAGHSITLTKPDGSKVTYTIVKESNVPPKLVTGKTVVIRTKTVNGQQTVERVTYSTTTTKS